MTKLWYNSNLDILLNIEHLEFFKNSYYKGVNERLLGPVHAYLFICWTLLSTIVYLVLGVTLITY